MSGKLISLTRRETFVAAASVCLSAAAPNPSGDKSAAVGQLVDEATRRPRALRDNAPSYMHPDVAAANLPVNSHEGTVDAAARSAALALEARRLRSNPLNDADRETLDALIWDLECDADLARFYWHEFPLGYFGSQLSTLGLQFLTPPAAGEAAAFLEKVRQSPAYVDSIRERLLGQVQRGLTSPRAEGDRALEQFHVEAKEVEASIGRNADAVAKQGSSGEAIAREVRQIASGPLAAALESLGNVIEHRYVPALDEQSKLVRASDAPTYFSALAKLRTSGDLDLEATNIAAQASLAEIDADLARIRKRLGAPADAATFHKSMVGNPRWYVRDADELKARLEAAIKEVEPLVPPYFHKMPKTPFGVAPVSEALQTRLLNGIFIPPTAANPRGTYFYNSSRLDISNWAWIKPLVSHELIPGHHLQMALLFEATDLPPYRKNLFVPAYAEGWGEYARQLMEEAGYYTDDPWGLYASRLLDRRFALRTAVETGVHHPSWTWQKAEAELATDPLTRPTTTQQLALAAATFRYGGLSYWWGLHRFRQLRKLAQTHAGPGFDIRDFHAVVMRGDLVPFEVAERRVRSFYRNG